MKPETKQEKASVTCLDLRIAVSVLICCLTATLLNHFGVKYPLGEMRLEIIQKMTACISCLLCCQDTAGISKKAGINRLIITAVGGITAIFVVLLDNTFTNEWLMVLMVAVGVLLTLYFCKLARVPYINARIGGVTFILVACTFTGNARIYYAVFRFISTLYAVLVVILVTWAYEKFASKKNAKQAFSR